MDTGVAIVPIHDAIAPAAMARLAEERGQESLFFPEHTHIPAARQSPWPGGRELPRRYAHTFVLFVAVTTAVTAAVTVTARLRVGSGICLVIERDYAAAGFQRAVHWLPSAPRGRAERALDRYEAAVAEFNGE